MMIVKTTLLIALATLTAVGCGSENGAEKIHKQHKPMSDKSERNAVHIAQVVPYKLIQKLPHDTTAFTQGLVVYDGMFLESTGQNGTSGIRRVNIMRGSVTKRKTLEFRFFGEGITVFEDKIYMLTWRSQQGFIFDATTFEQTGTFRFLGEGWGLTTDGTMLYMSNGTNVITVRDPNDFHIVRTISVTHDGRPRTYLNELEWIDGELWANVWKMDVLMRIDPTTGVVHSVVDLTGILPLSERPLNADVLNGIAYDSLSKAIYVTGKNWPWMYQIELE